jgi:hypothetical protein
MELQRACLRAPGRGTHWEGVLAAGQKAQRQGCHLQRESVGGAWPGKRGWRKKLQGIWLGPLRGYAWSPNSGR